MVHKDEKTVAFRKATDYIKAEKGISLKEIAKKIDIKRNRFDFLRTQRVKVTDDEIKNLTEKYPETLQFFTKMAIQQTREPMILYNDGNTLRSLVETQRKLIEKLEKEIEILQKKVSILEGENKALQKIIKDEK